MTKHLSIQKVLAALLTIAAIATGQTVWADDVTLLEDNDFGTNEVGHWYVNMPTDGKDYLTLNVQDLQNGKNVFKVYDDGGKNGNYTSGCDSKIVINVPDGYLIQISGTVWTYYDTSYEFLKVFDGNEAQGTYYVQTNLLAKVYSPTDGEATDFGPLNTTGNAMYLYFRSRQNQTTTFQGLDLTVTVFENVLYNISVAEGIEHGSVTPSVSSAHFNDAVTLTVTPAENYYIGTVTWNDGTTDHVITPTDNGVYSFNMPQHDVTVSATFLDDVGHFWGEGNDGSEALPYVISDKDGWDLLIAKSTSSNNIAQNKYFELTTDISGVTQSVHNFGGHLDGKGHKITLEMGMDGIGLIDLSYYGCTISNLTVEGSIENPAAIVGGFIAQSAMINNTITLTDCRSSVTITSTYSGTDHYCGGFVGKAVNVECVRCVFDGAFVSSTAFGFSGLVGSCLQLSVTDCAVVFGSATSLTYQNGANFSFANYSQITKQGHNFYFNKGYIFYIIPNGITPVYPLTFTEPAAAVRTGGTAIGNGAGTAYADGFTHNGDEYYQQSASVIFGASGLLVTAAQYNDGANHAATINTDGTASFTMPVAATTATATGFAAQYIDADGTEQICDPVNLLLSSNDPVNKAGGWYAVTGDVTLRQGLVFSGAAHLILCDGATLNVKGKKNDVDVIIAVGATDLSVYGQAIGTGTLNADIGAKAIQDITLSLYAIKATGSLVFCGGQVNAHAIALASTTQGGFNCYGIYTVGSVNLIRGSLNVSAEKEIVPFGSVFVPTSATLYDITAAAVLLDWRCPTDRICLTAPEFMSSLSPVSVAEGKALWNGTEVLSGTIYNGGTDRRRFNGKTLEPCIPREVVGYGTGNGGWVFISSPVTGNIAPTTVGGLMASTATEYDLYRFNQSAALEWENYKVHSTDFNLVNGQGYLYATKETKTLAFMGDTFNMGTEDVEVPLVYDEGKPLAGWNLVGNPFTVSATLTQPYYRMNAEGSALKTETETTAVAAMEGVFVQANQDSQTVTFTAQTRGGEQATIAQANIMVGGDNGAVIDNAIIRFDGGQALEKFSFREGSTKIYIPQDGTDYAIACAESTGEMPLNFKAETDGTYTISVDVDNVEMGYLHLIDNMTGADVDLLAANGGDARPCVSTYTFTAKTTDYESRFKLVFSICEDANGDNAPFAFISNGNLIVNGEGTLQVFDVLGHQLVTKQLSTLNSQLSTLNYKSGVYMLRLINGDKVRTQKIVVE